MTERKDPPIIVSACLAGRKCRYDGKDNTNSKVIALIGNQETILVCPEQMGGLPTPRSAAGRDGDKVTAIDGSDYTAQFNTGAESTARIAELNGCKKAILKARSPSCGVGRCIGIKKLQGGEYEERDGVAAEKLRELGLKLLTEEDL